MTLPPAYTQTCRLCGGRAANWHEKLPRGRGGPRDSFNAVSLCGSGTTGCHGKVTGDPDFGRSVGLTVDGDMIRGVYYGPDPAYRVHYPGAGDPTLLLGHPTSDAQIDPTDAYRWWLWRRLECDGPTVCWVMLNPSTADAHHDDPTLRRVLGFSRREGARAVHVVNLYGLRTSDPDLLCKHDDPVGPDNDRWVAAAVSQADLVIAAWGAADTDGRGLSWWWGRPLLCLGTTVTGHPRHPLYLPADQPLEPWPC